MVKMNGDAMDKLEKLWNGYENKYSHHKKGGNLYLGLLIDFLNTKFGEEFKARFCADVSDLLPFFRTELFEIGLEFSQSKLFKQFSREILVGGYALYVKDHFLGVLAAYPFVLHNDSFKHRHDKLNIVPGSILPPGSLAKLTFQFYLISQNEKGNQYFRTIVDQKKDYLWFWNRFLYWAEYMYGAIERIDMEAKNNKLEEENREKDITINQILKLKYSDDSKKIDGRPKTRPYEPSELAEHFVNYAIETGDCDPSGPKLMDYTGISQSKWSRSLRNLKYLDAIRLEIESIRDKHDVLPHLEKVIDDKSQKVQLKQRRAREVSLNNPISNDSLSFEEMGDQLGAEDEAYDLDY